MIMICVSVAKLASLPLALSSFCSDSDDGEDDLDDDDDAMTMVGTGGLAGGPDLRVGAAVDGGDGTEGADVGGGGLGGEVTEGGDVGGGGLGGAPKHGGGGGASNAGGDPHTETSGDQSDPSAWLSSTTMLGNNPVLPLHSPIHQPSSHPLGFLETMWMTSSSLKESSSGPLAS